MNPYPVVSAQRLPPAPRGLLWSRRRDRATLPDAALNMALVFEVDGRFVEFPGGRHLTGTEQAVVDAVSVSVVDKRPNRPVEVTFELESGTPDQNFTVTVSFTCTVVDAGLVAQQGMDDLSQILERHVLGDLKLLQLGLGYSIDQTTPFKTEIAARTRTAFEVDPPDVDGVRVALAGVKVSSPSFLVDHRRKLQAERMRQELEHLKKTFPREEARLVEEVLARGPEAVASLAMQLGDMNAGDLTRISLDRTDKREERLRAIYQQLVDVNFVDRVNVPTEEILDVLLGGRTERQLDGTGGASGGHPPAARIDNGWRRRVLTEDEGDDLPPADEDDVGA